MREPLVTVLLDNYNYDNFIAQAIDSVLAQTYKNYELLIVDDGSKDSSREIIDRYAARYPAIRKVYKENGGQMSAFNAGFALARGELVALLDSDDYWYPDKLEKIVEKHRNYRLVQHYLSNNGRGIYREVRTDVDWHEVLIRYGYLYNHSVCSSLSFERSLLEPFFPMSDEAEMRYCADGVALMIALSLDKIGFVEEELGFYRIHGNNGYAGRTDSGEKARAIQEAQHSYVNRQLRAHGCPEIPFSRHSYFCRLIGDMLKDGRLSREDRLFLYGTEASGLYLTEALNQFGIEVAGYADSDPAKQGGLFLGRRIYAPEELNSAEFDRILIASSAQKAISGALRELGLRDGGAFYSLPI